MTGNDVFFVFVAEDNDEDLKKRNVQEKAGPPERKLQKENKKTEKVSGKKTFKDHHPDKPRRKGQFLRRFG